MGHYDNYRDDDIQQRIARDRNLMLYRVKKAMEQNPEKFIDDLKKVLEASIHSSIPMSVMRDAPDAAEKIESLYLFVVQGYARDYTS